MTTKTKTTARRRKGEGSFHFDAKRELWVGRVTIDGRQKTVSAKLEGDCVKKLDELKRDMRRGAVITKQRGLTVGDILDHWLNVSRPNAVAKRGGAAPSTGLGAGAFVRRLNDVLGSRPIARLTVDDVEQGYRKIALGEGGKGNPTGVDYLMRMRITLRRAVADGVRRRVLSDSVLRIVDDALLPLDVCAPSKERIALTPDQMRTLIASSKDHRLHAAVQVALSTGLRPGELTALYWDALHLDAPVPYLEVKRGVQRQQNDRYAVVPDLKNAGAYRDLALTPEVVDALRAHRLAQNVERIAATSWANPDLVFATIRGTVINPSNLRREFEKLTKAAGVPKIVPYETRHSVATALSESDLNTFQIVDILGHENDRMINSVYRKRRKAIISGGADVMAKALGAKSK